MDMTRNEWLDARRTGIGGSDVAPILGLSKWRTPLDVYLDKRGESPPDEDNDAMYWGRTLEPVIREHYVRTTGRSVSVPSIIKHPTHQFMLANVDGLTDCRRVLEVKTARSGQDWGEPGSDEIPESYALQVQHYLAVTGFDVADIAVLIGGSDFRLYEVQADKELQELLVEREAAFWQRVINGDPPEPVSAADAIARFGGSAAAGEVQADKAVADACAMLHDVRERIKAWEAMEEEHRAVLLNALGNHGDSLVFNGKTLATWKLAKGRESFDSKAFAAAHPDLYQQFVRRGNPSRRLLLK